MSTDIQVSKRRSQPRPTGPSVLWGHLFSKENSASRLTPTAESNPGSLIPPIMPADKAGTSLRILLHDTQANLEKFSHRVANLTEGVDKTKREMAVVQKLFQEDHEKLIEETVALVNRCQSEIQRSFGRPAQAQEVEEVGINLTALDRRVEALEKKIDVMHMLNQTQSQALQTIQDQQGKMLAALIPVLPLLQAVPVHIENARNHITDNLRVIQHACTPQAGKLPPTSSIGAQREMAARTSRVPLNLSSPASSQSSEDTHPQRKKRKLNGSVAAMRTPLSTRAFDLNNVAGSHPSLTCESMLHNHSKILNCSSRLSTMTPSTVKRSSPLVLQTPGVSNSSYLAPLRTPRRTPLAGLPVPNVTFPELVTSQTKTPVCPARSTAQPLRHRSSGSTAIPDVSSCTQANATSMTQDTPKKVDSLVSNTTTLSARSSGQQLGTIGSNTCATYHPGPSSSTPSLNAPEGDHLLNIDCASLQVALRDSGPRDRSAVKTHHLASYSATHVNAAARGPRLPDEAMSTQSSLGLLAKPPFNANAPLTGPGVPEKTMSIKDRRALFSTPAAHNEGKRFIPLDDDEDGDLLD